MNFGSHADRVVTMVVALVNAVTPGFRQGRVYPVPVGELPKVIRQALGRPGEVVDAAAFAALGRDLRPVFERIDGGDRDGAAGVVNGLLAQYGPTPYLDHHDGEPWHLHFHGDPSRDPSGWGGGASVALATVLGSGEADRLGVCQAPACDRVYVDVSKNGTRRFCSTACQNRVKAAAHRARQGAG